MTNKTTAHVFYIDASINNTIGFAARRGNSRAVSLLAGLDQNKAGELESAYNHVASIVTDKVEPTFTMMQNLETAWTDNKKIAVSAAVKAQLENPTYLTSLFARSMMVGDVVVLAESDVPPRAFVCASCGWVELNRLTTLDFLVKIEADKADTDAA